MEGVPKTRLKPFRPSREDKLEDYAYNSGVVRGEQNVISFLMGYDYE